VNETFGNQPRRPTTDNPFKLPADTLAEAVTKAHAILKYWRESGSFKAKRDELDACYAVATGGGGARWGNGLAWRQLVAVVKDQPIPLE
jgi:hypothetical protein